jgi:hypothetical protein
MTAETGTYRWMAPEVLAAGTNFLLLKLAKAQNTVSNVFLLSVLMFFELDL